MDILSVIGENWLSTRIRWWRIGIDRSWWLRISLLCSWTGIDHGLLRVHQDLTMVLCFADFDTHTNNNGGNNGQPHDTSNHSASYRSSRRRTIWVVVIVIVVVVTELSSRWVVATVVVITVIGTLRRNWQKNQNQFPNWIETVFRHPFKNSGD